MAEFVKPRRQVGYTEVVNTDVNVDLPCWRFEATARLAARYNSRGRLTE